MADNNLLAKHGVSPQREQAMWDAHRLEQLLAWADLPFERKVQCLEEMEETALAFGNRFDPATGRLGKHPSNDADAS